MAAFSLQDLIQPFVAIFNGNSWVLQQRCQALFNGLSSELFDLQSEEDQLGYGDDMGVIVMICILM